MRKSSATKAVNDVRTAYDESLSGAGIVLVRQIAAGADSHYVSRSALDILGWDPAAFLTPGTLRAIVHVEDLQAFRTVATDSNGEAAVVRLRHANGSFRSFRFGVRDEGLDRPLTFTLVDVSADAAARRRRRRAEELLDRSLDAVIVLRLQDFDDATSIAVEDLNPAASELLRRPSVGFLDEVIGDESLRLIRNAAFDVAHTGEPLAFDRLQLTELPGRQLDAEISRLSDGTVALRLIDVTQQASLEDHLRHRALHDQRTGLPNLVYLEERLADLAHGSNEAVGLLTVDLRTPVVDDELVGEVARRLAGTLAPAVLLARVGECRLAALAAPILRDEELETLCQTVSAALAIPFDVKGDAIAVDALVGAASAVQSDAVNRLVRDAEAMTRVAEREDRSWAVQARRPRENT